MRTDNLPAADVKKRNSGIELLRIIAMFSIVVLHIVGIGGINNAYPLHSAGYAAALRGGAAVSLREGEDRGRILLCGRLRRGLA